MHGRMRSRGGRSTSRGRGVILGAHLPTSTTQAPTAVATPTQQIQD
jgi:hypothetical protein